MSQLHVRVDMRRNGILLEGIERVFEPGVFTVLSGRSDHLLGSFFYVALGLLEPAGGRITSGDEPISRLVESGIAVVDLRSAPPHEKSLVEHVAEGAGGDRRLGAERLRAVGVADEFHDCLPGAEGPAAIAGKGTALFGFDKDSKRFFGLLAKRPELADRFLANHRIPLALTHPYRERIPTRRQDDVAASYRAREEELQELRRTDFVPASDANEPAYKERLSCYTPLDRQETAWAYILKLTEVARALACRPDWIFILDSDRVAGQACLGPLYPRLYQWTRSAEPRPGVALFAPARMAPFDDLAALGALVLPDLPEDPCAEYQRPRASDMDPGTKSPREGLEFLLRGLSHSYDGGKSWTIRNLDLDVERGRTLVVMGGSGCGKSTILRVAAGLEKPAKGLVAIDDRAFNGEGVKPDDERRKNMGVLFQEGALFNSMTVAQNDGALRN